VIDDESLELKRFLIRELDLQDISTHGLTFTIKTNRSMFYFTSIVIEKNPDGPTLVPDYNILYAKNFNPTSVTYLTYARQVKKEVIPALLIELSKIYYRQLNPEKETVIEETEPAKAVAGAPISFQCTNCLTVYSSKWGDSASGIPPGVPFEDLPDTYRCHVCGSEKGHFEPAKHVDI
jgi:rubredoxin